MALAYATGTIVIDYGSDINRPNGFRLYYRPEKTGTTVNHSSPSISIPMSDYANLVLDDQQNYQVVINLPYRLPLFEIDEGGQQRTIFCGLSRVDENGNVGDIQLFEINAQAPFQPILTNEILSADGEFNSDGGWTLGLTHSISGGELTITEDGSAEVLAGTVFGQLEQGQIYKIQIEISFATVIGSGLKIFPGTSNETVVPVDIGLQELFITMSETESAFTLVYDNNGEVLTINRISIARVTNPDVTITYQN